jgi:C-terminal processing protease CtpA/Prc
MYLSRFGYTPNFRIDFIDTLGKQRTAVLPIYRPVRDSAVRIGEFPQPPGKLTRRERKKLTLQGARSMSIDPQLQTAFMSLNTFTPDAKLPTFFRRSFRKLRQQNVQNLVIDLRGNGGGSVTNSNLLTRYLAQHRFKIADTLFATKRNSNYGKYQEKRFFNWMFLQLMTRKRKDGLYHFPLYEGKYFPPKKKNHFEGHVYILSGGNSFSASTLVMQTLRAQKNVTLVGEESGGAAYGNNAWLIPDVTLPNTRVRFRLPLFRLVIDKNEQKGYGVQPEVFVPPTREKIIQNADFKLDKVLELIKASQTSPQ